MEAEIMLGPLRFGLAQRPRGYARPYPLPSSTEADRSCREEVFSGFGHRLVHSKLPFPTLPILGNPSFTLVLKPIGVLLPGSPSDLASRRRAPPPTPRS